MGESRIIEPPPTLLKVTQHLQKGGWETILLGRPIVRGQAASFREGIYMYIYII